MPDHVIISNSSTDHIIDTVSNYSNTDPIDEERERIRRYREALKPRVTTHNVQGYGEYVHPDPLEAMRAEQTREYTKPAKCEWCGYEYVVFRKSDERFSPKKDRMVSNVGRYDYPIWVPIDATLTKRDRWGNYRNEITEVQIHRCQVERMGEDDLRKCAKHMFERQVEFEKEIAWKFEQLRKEAILKEFVVE
jgi:hypothetical protein